MRNYDNRHSLVQRLKLASAGIPPGQGEDSRNQFFFTLFGLQGQLLFHGGISKSGAPAMEREINE